MEEVHPAWCLEFLWMITPAPRGGLLHEIFHVLGIQHTQERPDRDRSILNLPQSIFVLFLSSFFLITPFPSSRHIEVLKENIKDQYEYSYDICHQCQDYGGPHIT